MSRLIKVKTNHFAVTQLPKARYHQYDVVIISLAKNEEVKNLKRRHEIFMRLQTVTAPPGLFPVKVLYDGRAIMYSARALKLSNGTEDTFTVNMTNNNQPTSNRGLYKVTLRQTQADPINALDVQHTTQNRTSNAASLTAINVVQLIIRAHSNQMAQYANNGKAYFSGRGAKDLGGGVELWRGFFQSVRPVIGRLLVNVDTTVAAMYKGGRFYDNALDVLGRRDIRDLNLDPRQPPFTVLQKFFKGLSVQVSVGATGKMKKITALEPQAGFFRFEKDGVEMSVSDYFMRTYNYKVQYPQAVGVHFTGKNSSRPVVVPGEIVMIEPGQFYKKKLDENMTRGAVQFSTTKPGVRLQLIEHGDQQSNLMAPVQTYAQSEFVAQAGMTIDSRVLSISGKMLEPPGLRFASSTMDLRDKNGAWNVLNQRFNAPANMQVWAAIKFAPRYPMGRFNEQMFNLQTCCRELGMNIGDPKVIEGFPQSPLQTLDDLYNMAKGNIAILVILLPQSAEGLRNDIKHWGDVTKGIRTQCIREGKVQKANDQYWKNIALKLNARLGGHNFLADSSHIRKLSESPFMIIGADVGHPSPGVLRPSITSLVYSTDRYGTKYSAVTGVQEPRLESIKDLQKMIFEAVDKFGLMNRAAPARYIFYRDGISEGEYRTVATEEIKLIEAGLAEIYQQRGLPRPQTWPLTYIVVTKKHHTVFFPGDRATEDRTGNLRAGFVSEDQGLRNPLVELDFFLQSHSAIQGTSRSSHYQVLHDKNFSFDKSILEKLSYDLCHVYAKATRSVSIPAPVYYADLVCARGKFHFPKDLGFEGTDSSSSAGGGQPQFDLPLWQNAYGALNGNLTHSMYYL